MQTVRAVDLEGEGCEAHLGRIRELLEGLTILEDLAQPIDLPAVGEAAC